MGSIFLRALPIRVYSVYSLYLRLNIMASVLQSLALVSDYIGAQVKNDRRRALPKEYTQRHRIRPPHLYHACAVHDLGTDVGDAA